MNHYDIDDNEQDNVSSYTASISGFHPKIHYFSFISSLIYTFIIGCLYILQYFKSDLLSIKCIYNMIDNTTSLSSYSLILISTSILMVFISYKCTINYKYINFFMFIILYQLYSH